MREGTAGGDRLILVIDEILGKMEWTGVLGGGTVLGRPKGLGGVLVSKKTMYVVYLPSLTLKCSTITQISLTRPSPPSTLPSLIPQTTFLTSLTPLNQPQSLTSRFIARPLWWALSRINPLGAGDEIKVESEDVMWRALRKVGTYVHLELVDVSGLLQKTTRLSH
jgi:hypothetical protein